MCSACVSVLVISWTCLCGVRARRRLRSPSLASGFLLPASLLRARECVVCHWCSWSGDPWVRESCHGPRVGSRRCQGVVRTCWCWVGTLAALGGTWVRRLAHILTTPSPSLSTVRNDAALCGTDEDDRRSHSDQIGSRRVSISYLIASDRRVCRLRNVYIAGKYLCNIFPN